MPSPLSLAAPLAGGRRRGLSVKTLKRALKKAGLKTTGRKAALTRRAKKAHLLRGGNGPVDKDGDVIMAQEQKDVKMDTGDMEVDGGRRRHRSRKH
jgi:hypothetical protein